jgi:hypothetical protein
MIGVCYRNGKASQRLHGIKVLNLWFAYRVLAPSTPRFSRAELGLPSLLINFDFTLLEIDLLGITLRQTHIQKFADFCRLEGAACIW